jgi:hypothetical protein
MRSGNIGQKFKSSTVAESKKNHQAGRGPTR